MCCHSQSHRKYRRCMPVPVMDCKAWSAFADHYCLIYAQYFICTVYVYTYIYAKVRLIFAFGPVFDVRLLISWLVILLNISFVFQTDTLLRHQRNLCKCDGSQRNKFTILCARSNVTKQTGMICYYFFSPLLNFASIRVHQSEQFYWYYFYHSESIPCASRTRSFIYIWGP